MRFGTDRHHHHGHWLEKKEVELLEQSVRLEREEVGILKDIRKELGPRQLSSIKLAFGGIKMATPVIGPVALNVGDAVTGSVAVFDQNGNPMPAGFVVPAVSYSMDNPAIASSTPNSDGQTDAVVALSAGVANLTASLTTAEGLTLTDTETVTVTSVVVVPVASSIKVAFAPAAASARKR